MDCPKCNDPKFQFKEGEGYSDICQRHMDEARRRYARNIFVLMFERKAKG